jgi:hypothetical protein
MVENPIAALAVVAGCLLVLIPMLAGIGLWIRRTTGLRTITADDCLLSVPVGYAGTLLFLMVWHLALPVGRSAFAVVLSAGLLGLAMNVQALVALAAASRRISATSLVAVSAAGVWVLAQSLSRFRSWDGALYHVQIVEWAKAYPIVPGLANLQGPLGFHSSGLLYDAMIDALWPGNGFRVANATLLLPVILLGLTAALRWLRGRASLTPAVVYAVVLLPAILHISWDLPSYSTDLPASILLLAAGIQLHRLLTAAPDSSAADRGYALLSLGLLLGGAVSSKLTMAVFTGVALAVALRSWLRKSRASADVGRRVVIATLILVTVFGSVTTWRSIVLTGYPFFPFSIAGAPVDWKAPAQHVDMERAYTTHTERQFSWRPFSGNWVRLILFNDVYAVVIPSGLAALALFSLWRRRATGGLDAGLGNKLGWLLLPSAVAMAIWIGTAPSHRYAVPLFWTAAAACVSAAATQPGSRTRSGAARVAVVVLALSPLIVEPAIGAIRSRSSVVRAVVNRNGFTREFRLGSAVAPAPPVVRPFVTASGLVLNVPVKSAPIVNGLPNACFNAPLPCTPTPSPSLRLRTPGNLGGGFAVDGVWAMEDWPFYWRGYFLPEWRARNPGVNR